MRELLSALGERYVRLAPASSALPAQYYRLAIEFGERGPDPEAFLGLVNIYADRNDAAGLHDLMDRYEYELFTEKGEAYARGDWPLIYRLHVALGMTYAHLGVWNDTPSPIQNAAFQLEAAQRAADELNRRWPSKKIALPPAAAKKLSGYYITTGQADRATKVQVDAAEVLQSQGRTEESAEILKSIDTETIPAADGETKAKYERLQRIIQAN